MKSLKNKLNTNKADIANKSKIDSAFRRDPILYYRIYNRFQKIQQFVYKLYKKPSHCIDNIKDRDIINS